MARKQNWDSSRMLEAIVRNTLPEYLPEPKQVQLLNDNEGRAVLYINWDRDSGTQNGDVAVFVRTKNVLPDEIHDNYIARTNTPGHKVGPAPAYEVWVQTDSMEGDRTEIKDQIIYFLRDKAGRQAVLKITTDHPTLEGIFGEAADSTPIITRGRASSPAPLLGGN